MAEKKQIEVHEEIDLKGFVEKNYILITIIGVFGALTAFFISLNIYLPFFSLMIFILLCWELWISFPKSEEATIRLTLFEGFFIGLFFSVIGYVLNYVFIEHKQIIPFFTLIIIFPFYLAIVYVLFEKLKLFHYVRKLSPEHSRFAPLVRALIFIILLSIGLLLTIWTSNLVRSYV